MQYVPGLHPVYCTHIENSNCFYSIIASHNYGLSEYINGRVNMISNDYDISMTAQSKLNKDIISGSQREM